MTAIIRKQKEREKDLGYIKKNKTGEKRLTTIGLGDAVFFPGYWSSNRDKPQRVPLDKTMALYGEIEKIVIETWESDKVGHGADAVNLFHKSIRIIKVWRLENYDFFKIYDAKRKQFCKVALANRFPRFNGLQGENEVATQTLGKFFLQ